MKTKLLILSLIVLYSLAATAQDHAAFMECHYAEKYRDNLLKKNKYRQDEMVLQISKSSSEFFSLWNRAHKKLTDSLLAKGYSSMEISAEKKKLIYPSSTQYETVYKNLPKQGMLTCTDRIGMRQHRYTEELKKPQWTITQETKTVANYSCQKAEADYLGRKWIAWFSVEIPISDGPWKLWGLPGLILEAADADDDYQFTCIEIKTPQGEEISVPKAKYIECSKAQYIKAKTLSVEDPGAYMKQQGMNAPRAVGKDGTSTSAFPTVQYNYIEKEK